MSVGDIVHQDSRWWQCLDLGWRELHRSIHLGHSQERLRYQRQRYHRYLSSPPVQVLPADLTYPAGWIAADDSPAAQHAARYARVRQNITALTTFTTPS